MLSPDDRGAHNFPLIVIFGVFMAFLLTLVFVNIYTQQLAARVEEQAEGLVGDLARTAFQSFTSGSLSSVQLPANVGGSSYSLAIVDNAAFVLLITSGQKSGSAYASVSTVRLLVENSEFTPGGRVYFLRAGDCVVISSSPIRYQPENLPAKLSLTPPEFYDFAKDRPVETAGVAAAYFRALHEHPGIPDVTGYRWEGENLLVKVELENGDARWFEASYLENLDPVGMVENAIIVSSVEKVSGLGGVTNCPSIENAWLSRWFYSPEDVLDHLRSRTWRRVDDNSIISVPGDAEIRAAAVTTNVSTYPAWRIRFSEFVVYYRAMPWWELENVPGFLFQSSPELTPVV